jgi:hypothetical protein
MHESKNKLLWIVQLLTVIAVCWLYNYYGITDKSPLVVITVYLIIALPMFWSWRNAKIEFIKRCILAVPFALSLAIIAKLAGFETGFSICLSIALFIILLFKTGNWKMHFAIIYPTALLLTFLLVYVGRGDRTIYKAYIVAAIGIPVIMFHVAYSSAVARKEPIKISSLFAKSIKFAVVLILTLYLLLWSLKLCRHYNLGFPVSFSISVLITAGFLGFCKFFNIKSPADLSMLERKTKKAKQGGVCECCGKTGIRQELLFKINSGQRVCVDCLKDME